MYKINLTCIIFGFLVAAAMGVIAEEADHLEIRGALLTELSDTGLDVREYKLQWPLLTRFYVEQDSLPVWHENGWLNSRGEALIDWISSADTEGLSPADYHLRRLELFPTLTFGVNLQLRELLLTDAFFRFARDLRSGRFKPGDYDPKWQLPSEPFDPVEALTQTLEKDAFTLSALEFSPATHSYRRLKQALSGYRRIEARGGWPQFTERHVLRPGDRSFMIEVLRERLQIEGDHPDSETGDGHFFDDQLKASVAHFQRRNGLMADGVVGPKTREALNIPVRVRIAQILANMERWRWLPQDLGEQYLMVNLAGFELTLMNNGEHVTHKRTISGKRQRQTPSFSSLITHLVVNPEWTVPRTIAVEDLLPQQLQDIEFLDRKGIHVFQRDEGRWIKVDPYSINWGQYNKYHFPFLLRQSPGKKNSLGRIKFHMASPNAIFLHGTPSTGLFKKPIRALSSGCVRVQDVEDLARILLDNGGQSAEKILDLPLKAGNTRFARLSKPMPVYLVYFTSWVDADGIVQFRPDIYNRNTNLLLALQKNRSELTASLQQIAAEAL